MISAYSITKSGNLQKKKKLFVQNLTSAETHSFAISSPNTNMSFASNLPSKFFKPREQTLRG